MKSTKNTFLFLSLLSTFQAFGQHNDCQTALQVCDKTTLEFAMTSGQGNMDDLSNTCLNMEFAPAWLSWEVQEAGKLTFVLTPSLATDDLDFAIFKYNTYGDCNDKTLVRCMAAGENVGDPMGSQPCLGPTGLSEAEADITELPGCNNGNNNFLSALDCLPGEAYVMVVNNFSNSGQGFTLEWGGDAVIFCDPTATSNTVAQEIIVWPNPALDFVEIRLPSHTGNCNFKIVDVMQRTVDNGVLKGTELRVNAADWCAGVYYLLMEINGCIFSQRLIKM